MAKTVALSAKRAPWVCHLVCWSILNYLLRRVSADISSVPAGSYAAAARKRAERRWMPSALNILFRYRDFDGDTVPHRSFVGHGSAIVVRDVFDDGVVVGAVAKVTPYNNA